MEIGKVEDMHEKLYRKGFDTHLNAEYDRNIEAGKADFQLEHQVTIQKDGKEDEMKYVLDFRRDDEHGQVYLNDIRGTLLKEAGDASHVREHTFPDKWLVTATEMYRMLKYGPLVSVNKDLFNKDGNPYNTYISIDVNGSKDEYGNYPVKSYHENYFKKEPFVIKEALQKLPIPVKEIENRQELENIEKALKKANLVSVTMLYGGEETTGTLALNPGERRIDVYDKNMQLIEGQQQSQKVAAHVAPAKENPETTQDDVKKKSGQDQKVTWTKTSQGKGMSYRP